MSAQDLEQRARELLAAEYERDGKIGSADHIRTQPLLPNKARAVRAIIAALRQQPAPVVDGAMRELIEAAKRAQAMMAVPARIEPRHRQELCDAISRCVEVDETTPPEHK